LSDISENSKDDEYSETENGTPRKNKKVKGEKKKKKKKKVEESNAVVTVVKEVKIEPKKETII